MTDIQQIKSAFTEAGIPVTVTEAHDGFMATTQRPYTTDLGTAYASILIFREQEIPDAIKAIQSLDLAVEEAA